VVACLLLTAGTARGREVLIVLSSDADPYHKAEAAIQDKLGQAGRPTSSALLASVAKTGPGAGPLADATAVVAVGTEAAAWLHGHLPAAVPLVYCLVADPEEAGLTTGSPVAGVSATVAIRDQVDLIAQALPHARSIGVIYDSKDPRDLRLVKQLGQALPPGWQVKAVAVNQYKSVAAAIEDMYAQGVDAVWTFADAEIYNSATVRTLLLAGLHHKVPVFGFSPQFVRAGALLGVGVSPAEQGAQAAALLLRQWNAAGTSQPAPEAHEAQPPQYQIAVNLIVTEALDLDLPADLVQRCAIVFRKEGTR
jgi:putative ABC transport system substrate-binding protein